MIVRLVGGHADQLQPEAPSYLPALWNRPDRRGRANCLAYALDDRAPGWRGSECTSVPGLTASLHRLGLRPATLRSLLARPVRRHLVAVFVSPPEMTADGYLDFHCYRLDRDGNWSHKPGPLAATRTDMHHQPLVVPWAAEHPFLITELLGLYWAG